MALADSLKAPQFLVPSKKDRFLKTNYQNCVAYISAAKCSSEAVLDSKRKGGYPISPKIKNIAVAFKGTKW